MINPSRAISFTAVAVSLGIVGLLLIFAGDPVPDFRQLPAGEQRKQAFFDFFRPLVERGNAVISSDRERVIELAEADPLNWWQRRQLHALMDTYDLDPAEINDSDAIKALLLRVDVVPVSLALAQAAKESGWGTSRFAVEGSNYFGQRCWEPGCGMLPRKRAAGMSFEVDRFSNPYHSVTSYLRNLNTHPEYEELRDYRAQLRASGQSATGIDLAAHLGTYSERQQAYIKDIQAFITTNNLESRP